MFTTTTEQRIMCAMGKFSFDDLGVEALEPRFEFACATCGCDCQVYYVHMTPVSIEIIQVEGCEN